MSQVPYIPAPPPSPPRIQNVTTECKKNENKCYYNDVRIHTDDFKQMYSVSMGSVLQTGPK